ncbi:MAG: carbamoyltransferase N-terminal domain-containing protein [Cyanobacteriota bacterium]
MRIIGISAYYHDSAAALLVNGEVLAAAQEERFSRRRHDARFPLQALRFCLESQGLTLADIDQVVYYEKPLLTFERLLETSLGAAPRGGRAFVAAMQVWLKHKLFLKSEIRRQLARLGDPPELLFSEHHLSHAAAAFHPSPFERAAVLCMDGVGEWATTSAWLGEGHALTPLWEISFPHSLGLLYSAFTAYCGFRVNSGEYKLMGLAPYGLPRFARTIRDHLVDVKPDGSFRLNLSHFRFHRGLRMTGRRFHRLFGQPPRVPESEITPFQMDLAASIQQVTEEIVLALARRLRAFTPWPGAHCWIPAEPKPRLLKVHAARVAPMPTQAEPGTVIARESDGLVVACGSDALVLIEVQSEGGRRMAVRDFLAGNPVQRFA